MNNKYAFLTSLRFWQLFVAGIMGGLMYAIPDNVIVQAASVTFGIWFGGSVTVGTIDRISDKKVEAAQVIADSK